MNVLFVTYHDFTSNSAVHIFNLANELELLGIRCAVCVPDNKRSSKRLGRPRFAVLDFSDARAGRVRFADGGAPTLVHAWTPRENVRLVTEDIVRRYRCPYLIHLEDNEDVISAHHLGVTIDEMLSLPNDLLNRRLPPTLSHPQRARAFLADSAGVTVIIDRLLELKPDELPGEVVWPGYERELFAPRPPDLALKRKLPITEGEFVAVYHGTNAAEMRSLYLAVAEVNRRGCPLRLVRLGRDFVDFLGEDRSSVAQLVVSRGYVPRPELGRYLSLADVLVQPGRADAFNEYRLPAKLPEFLAVGRPVVLPASNIGRYLRDGENCLLLHEGGEIEIADAVERLLQDPGLRDRLARAGRSFAEENFSWPRSASKLKRFYARVLERVGTPAG